jgi:hypothetical protein
MVLHMILVAAGAGCLGYMAVVFFAGKDGAFLAFLVGVICLCVGIPGLVGDAQKPLPPIPASGPFTQAESAAYTGPVSAGTYFLFLNWAGELDLGTVSVTAGSQASRSGTSSGSVSGGFLFLGIGGFGGGHATGTSDSTTVTLPYRAYEFAVTNQAGQTIIVTFPAASLEFSALPPGQKPSVRFTFTTTVYYRKDGDRTSIFAPHEDSEASGDGPYGGDMGMVFANTPIGTLLSRFVVTVQAQVTAAQLAALTNPSLPGVPAS